MPKTAGDQHFGLEFDVPTAETPQIARKFGE
jgi:hypothetical protein